MNLLDFILNVTGLLLWLGWCSRSGGENRSGGPALAGVVKGAALRRPKRWPYLAGLIGLLAGRSLFYFEIGSAMDWTPKLDFDFVVLAFRGDQFGPIALFSLMSFVRVLAAWYFWVLCLVLVNRKIVEPDPLLKLLRGYLGRAARWHPLVLALLPVIVVTGLWIGANPLLVRAAVVTLSPGFQPLVEQALLLTLALVISLKYLVAAVLILHLVTSYVYLGASPVWDFIRVTACHLLKPVECLPLRFRKADMTPVAGLLLALVLLHWVPQAVETELSRRGLPLWPQ